MKSELILNCEQYELDTIVIEWNPEHTLPLDITCYAGESDSTVNLSKEKANELYEFLHKALGKDDK